MENELDSRNTSIKRVHDADQEDDPESIKRSRFKRQRASSGAGEQENAQQVDPSDGAGHKNGFAGPGRKSRRPGNAPSVNWNAGTKATISTSLKDRGSRMKRDAVPKGTALLSSDAAIAERDKCERKLVLLDKALRKIRHIPSDSRYQDIEQQIRSSEVDLQYCLNFPITKEYKPLFPPETTEQNSHEPRPPLWDVVRQCMEDGSLNNLRTGALDTRLAEKGIDLQPKLLQEALPQEADQEGQIEVPGSNEPRGVFVDNPLAPPVNVESGVDKKPQNKKFRDDGRSSMIVELSPETEVQPEPRAVEELDESEDGVVLNLTANDNESGEISETSPRSNYLIYNEGSVAGDEHQHSLVNIRGASDSGQDDAMIEYSNSDQPMKASRTDYPVKETSTRSYQPSKLAELGEEDLRAQLKYFYVAQDTRALDLATTPVKCLLCCANGHMAASCPKLTCADCGAYNDHFPPFCPSTRRCLRCLKRGHNQAQCKSKLKASVMDVTCDLCSNFGHVNEDCELLWRSSEIPEDPQRVAIRFDRRPMHLSCYECGGPYHLGNDCPSRRPGKSMGTSTWSLLPKAQAPPQISIRSKGEMSIKGRASQQKLVTIDSEFDDERSNFVRPKVPVPNKVGQIRIQPPRHDNQTATWTSVNEPYHSPSQYSQDPRYSSYPPTNRRSMSPRQTQSSYYSRADSYQPPLPQEPPPPTEKGYLIDPRNHRRGDEYYRHYA